LCKCIKFIELRAYCYSKEFRKSLSCLRGVTGLELNPKISYKSPVLNLYGAGFLFLGMVMEKFELNLRERNIPKEKLLEDLKKVADSISQKTITSTVYT